MSIITRVIVILAILFSTVLIIVEKALAPLGVSKSIRIRLHRSRFVGPVLEPTRLAAGTSGNLPASRHSDEIRRGQQKPDASDAS